MRVSPPAVSVCCEHAAFHAECFAEPAISPLPRTNPPTPPTTALLALPACLPAAFSLRLTNADLPRLREILKRITDDQYRKMLEGVRTYLPAFSWNAAKGGKSFDYTIASLRRRYMNFKARQGQGVGECGRRG